MTKSDTSRQTRNLIETSASQEIAIDALASGGTTLDAAKASRVTRQTVSIWRNHHPGFRAKLNLRRTELLAERSDRIRDLDTQALAVIAQAIEEDDRGCALAWVKMRRFDSVDVTTLGPTRAEAILDADVLELRSRPEHLGDTQAMFDDIDENFALTRSEAREQTKEELVELLKTGKR